MGKAANFQIQSVKLSEKWKAKGKAEKKEEADKWALKRSSSIEELINQKKTKKNGKLCWITYLVLFRELSFMKL